VITGFLPGQESPNVDFVVESGVGKYSPKDDELMEEIRVLAEGGPTWREMSRKAAELAHPYASSDIARECLLGGLDEIGLVERQHQVEDRSLAAARRTDEDTDLSRRDREGEVVDRSSAPPGVAYWARSAITQA